MRGKLSKQLRHFAKTDAEDLPWVNYAEFRLSVFSNNTTTKLHNCGKAYYKLLKRIWKSA